MYMKRYTHSSSCLHPSLTLHLTQNGSDHYCWPYPLRIFSLRLRLTFSWFICLKRFLPTVAVAFTNTRSSLHWPLPTIVIRLRWSWHIRFMWFHGFLFGIPQFCTFLTDCAHVSLQLHDQMGVALSRRMNSTVVDLQCRMHCSLLVIISCRIIRRWSNFEAAHQNFLKFGTQV